ncbi:RNase A-like domain-containing protein [Streptomyces reniochalinae]|uniref:Bacterial CdiA-CT RNAse A domain-containing protein n=1 Tax=Streptomyces reniochalinae TaxID=2250578 RepID=A0A367E7X6_9ACTN|nr:RNase A-like domain-containing protein [Streptomyces reniochalinae]RCG13765.1 hypothetical protein DQ392_31215 [Streptomyces reniochalinae]
MTGLLVLASHGPAGGSRSQRSPGSGPGAAPHSGGFDVKRSDLYRVSQAVAAQQGVFHSGINAFLDELDKHGEAGGAGAAPSSFASAYARVAARFLDVCGKSVVSVGGAAIGFTVTANNYGRANAASNPRGGNASATQPEPQVKRDAPRYRSVKPLGWNTSGGDGLIDSILDGIDTGFWAAFRTVLEHAVNFGDAADVMPLPDYQSLSDISTAWLMPQTTVGTVGGTVMGSVGSITDQSNSEWYAAMRTFCSSLWGSSAWGQSRHGYDWGHDTPSPKGGAHQPVFAVLNDTASDISAAVEGYAQAAKTVRDDMRRIYYRAVLDALPDVTDGIGLDDVKKIGKTLFKGAANLSSGIVLNIDTGALESAKRRYERSVNVEVSKLEGLMEALDEAHRSAPDFHAEEARAQAFAARSLNEFKTEHTYAVPGEDYDNHFYPIDLAAQEGIHGAHALDKHVGKTEDQLVQRLRDDSGADSASTFRTPAAAQRYTQAVLDDVDNAEKIEKWVEKVEARERAGSPRNPEASTKDISLDFKDPTGRTISRDEYSRHGDRAQASDCKEVKVVLRYKKGIDPPFVVLTSYPTK